MRCVAARRRFVTFDEKDGLGILEDFSLRLVPDFVNLTKSVQSLLKTLVPIAERPGKGDSTRDKKWLIESF